MTKENIFRIALVNFNIMYDKIKDDADSFELSLCEVFLPAAESAAAKLYDWSFLLNRVKLTEGDREAYEDDFGELKYIYSKPSDMMKPIYINGKYDNTIKVIGESIAFDVPNPELTYVTNKIDYNKFPYPSDYGYLIAYELALQICDMVMPEKVAIKKSIAQKIEMTAQLLISSDIEGNREQNKKLSWIGEIEE